MAVYKRTMWDLPTELVALIFDRFLHPTCTIRGHNRKTMRQLVLLASVCRRWRAITFDIPALWKHIELLVCDRWALKMPFPYLHRIRTLHLSRVATHCKMVGDIAHTRELLAQCSARVRKLTIDHQSRIIRSRNRYRRKNENMWEPPVPQFPVLRSLSIAYAKFGEDEFRAWMQSAQGTLETLALPNCTFVPSNSIGDICMLGCLRELMLRHCTSAALSTITKALSQTLTSLNLSGTSMGSNGFKHISTLMCLESLNISDTFIEDIALNHICRHGGVFETLRKLFVERCRDLSGDAFADIRFMKRLVVLYASHTEINDNSLDKIIHNDNDNGDGHVLTIRLVDCRQLTRSQKITVLRE